MIEMTSDLKPISTQSQQIFTNKYVSKVLVKFRPLSIVDVVYEWPLLYFDFADLRVLITFDRKLEKLKSLNYIQLKSAEMKSRTEFLLFFVTIYKFLIKL